MRPADDVTHWPWLAGLLYALCFFLPAEAARGQIAGVNGGERRAAADAGMSLPSPQEPRPPASRPARTRKAMTHGGVVRCVAFSPDGKTLASGGDDNAVKLWDVPTGEQRATLTGHTDWVWSLAYSLDGKTLASVSKDTTIKLWDVRTGTERATLTGHADWQCAVAFSPDGGTLAEGGKERTIRLWDVASRKVRSTWRWRMDWLAEQVAPLPKEEAALAYSPDGTTLASQNVDKAIHLWDAATGTVRATLNEQGLRGGSAHLAYSPDGTTLASASEGGIVLWDLRSGKEGAGLKVPQLQALAYSPDGKTLASGDQGGALKLWDVRTGKGRATIKGHRGTAWSVAFSPDGRTLASGGQDKTIHLWDMAKDEDADASKAGRR